MNSIKYLLVAALSLVPRSLGAPTGNAGQGTTLTATFEDVTVGTVPPFVPTPYQGLSFPAFNVGPTQPNVESLQPQSPPHCAITSVRGQTLAGSNPMISTAYPGSTVKSFDLLSFYFGCTVNSQLTVAGAIGCTLQVTGTKAGTGETVGPEFVNFAPANAVAGTGISLQSPMASASFWDLTGLSSVTLLVVLSSIPAAAQQDTTLYIDNIVHTNYE
ncbi:MAG: hypothetical protein M1826_004696 [Phylliscum demangeonii]|nr:MAG: hypothetical protein M1826_004696 [Phylliscum demangeonii]